jgi:hypothetical protein
MDHQHKIYQKLYVLLALGINPRDPNGFQSSICNISSDVLFPSILISNCCPLFDILPEFVIKPLSGIRSTSSTIELGPYLTKKALLRVTT